MTETIRNGKGLRKAGLGAPAAWPAAARLAWRLTIGRLRVGRVLGVALLLALAIVRLWDPTPVGMLRLKTFDLYQLIQPRQATEQPIAIVDLDEESLSEFGQWPWPRTLIAELIEGIGNAGAAVIGLDIIFAEPDRLSPEQLVRSLSGIGSEARAELRRLPSNDATLADALRRHRVVLGQSGYQRAVGDTSRAPASIPVAMLGQDPRPFLVRFPGLVRNIQALEDAAVGRAMLTLVPERDGIVRRVPAVMTVDGAFVPALVLEVLRVATGGAPLIIKADEAGVRGVVVGGVEVPTDRNGRIWVNYARHDPTRYISARDVIASRSGSPSLAGKLVVVGSSATGLYDVKSTPLDPAMPGAEIHAQLLETILTGSYLIRPHYALGVEVVMTVATGLLMIVLVPVLGALFTLLLGAAIAAALAGGSWYLYLYEGTLIDVAYPLVASLAVYVTLLFVNYFHEETQRRWVRSAFGQYLSPTLVEQLAHQPERLVLGGENRVMSFLFCDVRDFTGVAESYKADPAGLTRLVNRLLTPLSNAILERAGTIDKYMGDAVMAFWNAPLDDPRHAQHACESALGILDKLEKLNVALAREAEESDGQHLDLRIGIGINTGECVVGNLGSDLRFDYSVLGDAVNLASRLEGLTKTYGVTAIVGSSTARVVDGGFALLELDLVRVVGKRQPECIYALLGNASLASQPAFLRLSANMAELLARYRAQDWAAARAALAPCRESAREFELLPLFDLYERRIRGFAAAPPTPDWDGVYDAAAK